MPQTGVFPPRDRGIPNPSECPSLLDPTGGPQLGKGLTLRTMAGVELERTREQWALHPHPARAASGLSGPGLRCAGAALETQRGDQEPEPPRSAWPRCCALPWDMPGAPPTAAVLEAQGSLRSNSAAGSFQVAWQGGWLLLKTFLF